MSVHVLVRLRVKYGENRRFSELMEISVARVASRGWTLVGAYQSVLGDLREHTHIWEAPDIESVYAAVDPRADNPERYAQIERLQSCLEDEVIQIVTKTSYSP
jgi:hypothetical protein